MNEPSQKKRGGGERVVGGDDTTQNRNKIELKTKYELFLFVNSASPLAYFH